ncbi:MAG: hypothetical protein IJK05_00910 [Bacteroidales bacterium]|nr:hypothetical protein [Bacteroidales bacterium]
MKTRHTHFMFWLMALAAVVSSCRPSEDPRQVESFTNAVPVWAEGRQTEKNLTLSFREVVKVGLKTRSEIRIAASTDYRLKVNGTFVGHGPCVAAHGFYRVDCHDLTPYLRHGENVVSVEVAGYNEPSYYLLSQPSFLQAEIRIGGKTVAWTGRDFKAYDLGNRKADVPKFSFQRPQMEYWILSPDHDTWESDTAFEYDKEVKLVQQEPKTLIARRVAYPDYTLREAVRVPDAKAEVFSFGKDCSGFLGMEVTVKEKSRLTVDFDELLTDGLVKQRMSFRGYIVYEFEPGHYTVESFEPYTMQFLQTSIEGDMTVDRVYMRDYCNSDVHNGQFTSSDQRLDRIFEAARETIRQSSLDVFMDTPSRERAGWLCDSFFSSRVTCDLSGNTLLEKNFLENYLLPEKLPWVPEGMLPMCYPSDHWNYNYIPNWAMWYVIELEEYLFRSGDRELIEQARDRMYALVAFFDKYLNEDGLLEKLDKWVFIEWSAANNFVQDVNYPTNMLYAGMLDALGRIYSDASLRERAESVRETIRKQSYDGRFFRDNAIRQADGSLAPTDNHTEVCQYYAFFFNTATPETYPELWDKLLHEFGPIRNTVNPYPDVPYANAFIGNYLRLELLSRAGEPRQLLEETIDYFLPMVELTGTLWEHMSSTASCNHGFASHLAHVIYRDVAGLYEVDRVAKTVTLRLRDVGLKSCSAVLPVPDGEIRLDWTCKDGKFDWKIDLPKGYVLTEK